MGLPGTGVLATTPLVCRRVAPLAPLAPPALVPLAVPELFVSAPASPGIIRKALLSESYSEPKAANAAASASDGVTAASSTAVIMQEDINYANYLYR